MSENLIWSEKYRPKNIKSLLGVDKNIKPTFGNFAIFVLDGLGGFLNIFDFFDA